MKRCRPSRMYRLGTRRVWRLGIFLEGLLVVNLEIWKVALLVERRRFGGLRALWRLGARG